MEANLLRDYPELRQFVLSNVKHTGTIIGAGAYGSVEKVEIPGALCAAKKIHDIFQDRSEIPAAEIKRATVQFVEECQLMSTLRHPHIVQFLGICFLPGSRLPALVMELLLTSLHDVLDPELRPNHPKPFIPLGLKHSILHNVANGLTYLHERSPPIIHRDLSARNVLLNSSLVAKIADLGVACIMPCLKAAATMTKAPGASVYMPPEAVAPSASNIERSKYDASIDIFSYGVIAIFTLSQVFPCNPLTSTFMDEENGLLRARSEVERRCGYMQMIYSQLRKGHPLIRMIEQCLHNAPAKRPGIREVLQLLEQARAEISDEESGLNKLELLRAFREKNEQLLAQPVTEDLERQLESSRREVEELVQQLSSKKFELHQAEKAVRREQGLNQDLRQELQMAQNARKDVAHSQDASGSPDAGLEWQEHSSRVDMDVLQSEELMLKSDSPQQCSPSLVDSVEAELSLLSSDPLTMPTATLLDSCPCYDESVEKLKFNVSCDTQTVAPCGMERGAATADKSFAYFAPYNSSTIHRYAFNDDIWQDLPPSPYFNSGLVLIDGVLTTVGGSNRDNVTSKLFTFQSEQWVKEYPSMTIARSSPAVVSKAVGKQKTIFIVIGGNARKSALKRLMAHDTMETVGVELFSAKSRRWYKLTSLPQPVRQPSATITCSNYIYVIGCDGVGYFSSLQNLTSRERSVRMQTLSRALPWKPLPPLPVDDSTAAVLDGKLVIVGGWRDNHKSSVSAINQLVKTEWVQISSLSSCRRRCLVVSVSPDKILVVGGFDGSTQLDTVEECVTFM